jgi:hypothetical protein
MTTPGPTVSPIDLAATLLDNDHIQAGGRGRVVRKRTHDSSTNAVFGRYRRAKLG